MSAAEVPLVGESFGKPWVRKSVEYASHFLAEVLAELRARGWSAESVQSTLNTLDTLARSTSLVGDAVVYRHLAAMLRELAAL